MRNAWLASLALASAALLLSAAATAAPVHVSITAAGGLQQWKSPPIQDPSWVNLSAWTWDAQTQQLQAAWMTNAMDANGHPGLGVCATAPNADHVCTDPHETNAVDADLMQLIDLDITEFNDWNGLTITLLAFQQPTWGGLWGAQCSWADRGCEGTPLSNEPCSAPTGDFVVTCVLQREFLTALGVSHIWISPMFGCDGDEASGCGGFLLGAGLEHGLILDLNHEAVPEPSALGAFGLGILLLGLYVGARRRRLR